MQYLIKQTNTLPKLKGEWDGEVWQSAEVAEINKFMPESKSQHPITRVKVLYAGQYIYVHFLVKDQYVKAVAKENQDSVCCDSCVEFFVEPKKGKGYFNFEINCGGTVLLYYCKNATPKAQEPVKEEWLKQLNIFHTLPKIVEPEIVEPVTWQIEYRIPKALFENYIGQLGELSGQQWRGNFYKCGDKLSQPHWAMWSDVEILNFHQPDKFQPLQFA